MTLFSLLQTVLRRINTRRRGKLVGDDVYRVVGEMRAWRYGIVIGALKGLLKDVSEVSNDLHGIENEINNIEQDNRVLTKLKENRK